MARPQNDAHRTSGRRGSMTRSVAPCSSLVVPFSRVHVTPPFLEPQTPYFTAVGAEVRCEPPRPRTVEAKRTLGFLGFTTMSVTAWPVNWLETWRQLTPPLLDL